VTPVISMVMFREDVSPNSIDLQAYLTRQWPDLPRISNFESDTEAATFHLGTSTVIIGRMPMPIPWSELEQPCEMSFLWKNATSEVRQHVSHWIVSVMDDLTEIELSTLLSKLTAAVMATSPAAMGVYWGNASIVIPKEIFIEFVNEILPIGPPVHIWIDFRVGRNESGTTSGYTIGMKALGHMEIETLNSTDAPGDLKERLTALAGYLLENGPVIQNGHTVGGDELERISVVYSKSEFGHEGEVMRLVYEQTETRKPWWKPW